MHPGPRAGRSGLPLLAVVLSLIDHAQGFDFLGILSSSGKEPADRALPSVLRDFFWLMAGRVDGALESARLNNPELRAPFRLEVRLAALVKPSATMKGRLERNVS